MLATDKEYASTHHQYQVLASNRGKYFLSTWQVVAIWRVVTRKSSTQAPKEKVIRCVRRYLLRMYIHDLTGYVGGNMCFLGRIT